MTLNLVKTIGGQNGAPLECHVCGSKHFKKSGIAWHCLSCQSYYPADLGSRTLKESLDYANNLLKDFDVAISNLKRIIKE